MSSKNDTKKSPVDPEDIQIDYDQIDVGDIMDQVKKKIEARPGAEADSENETPPGADFALSEEQREEFPVSKAKKLALKLMRPFSPLIKFLVLPVHQELRETVHLLDNLNRRVRD